MKKQDLSATEDAKQTAIELLNRSRNTPNFGNAGAVENALASAKTSYQIRKPTREDSINVVLEPQDFDPEHDRMENAASNLAKLFEDVVGCEEIIRTMSGYQEIARKRKQKGLEVRGGIPMNFLFKGPPGQSHLELILYYITLISI